MKKLLVVFALAALAIAQDKPASEAKPKTPPAAEQVKYLDQLAAFHLMTTQYVQALGTVKALQPQIGPAQAALEELGASIAEKHCGGKGWRLDEHAACIPPPPPPAKEEKKDEVKK